MKNLTLLAIIFLSLLITACGKKGDPQEGDVITTPPNFTFDMPITPTNHVSVTYKIYGTASKVDVEYLDSHDDVVLLENITLPVELSLMIGGDEIDGKRFELSVRNLGETGTISAEISYNNRAQSEDHDYTPYGEVSAVYIGGTLPKSIRVF